MTALKKTRVCPVCAKRSQTDHQLPDAPPPEDRPPLNPLDEDELNPLERRPDPPLELVCTLGIDTFSLASWPQFLQW